ncbi:CLUMA_CG012656, isoform A, partial [Clunio marinus]
DFKRPIYDELRVDPLFRKISKHSVGFHVFKIENDHIESVTKDQVGTFYDENVYIIYSSAVKGAFSDQNTISREIKSTATIERFIHVWLGVNSSPLKSKQAALKIIELDLHLHHMTAQYRETQGHETKRFLAYFKEFGFLVLSGNDQKSTPEIPRLYQIFGKTCPRCVQMKSLSWLNFNSGNVMILLTHRIVFVWVGRSSSSIERVHALNVAGKLRDCQEIVVVDDGYEQSMANECKFEWNNYLNLRDRLVHPLVVSPSSQNSPFKLYKCTNLNGLFRAEHIKTDAIEQIDLMDKNSTFIIDGESMGIWIWIGRNISKVDKAEGMRHARGYIIKREHPSYYPVCRIIDGHEPIDFISLFPQWNESDFGTFVSSRQVLEKFDALTLIQRPQLAAQMQLIDDGSGEVKVYRIDSEDITDIPKRYEQVFYSENCYIIHYQTHATVNSNHSIKHIIYLWIGKHSKQMDKTTGELFLTEMFDHFDTHVAQIRVNEGMEPPHFLQLMKGKMIVLNGSDSKANNRKFSSTYILKVIGNSSYTSKAVQVTNKTSHSPTDCYIIKSDSGAVWVWCGHSSTGDTREMAKNISGILGEPNLIMEGAENEEFYESVGDKCLSQMKTLQHLLEITLCNTWDKSRVNLYLVSLVQSQIHLEQIFAFNQMDLTPENIYLLDAGSIIYVWLGNLVDSGQKQTSWIVALHLISIHPIPRNVTVPIAVIKQSYEPITFTGFFDNWDPKLFELYKGFEKLRIHMNLPGTYPVPSPRKTNTDDFAVNEFDKHQKYPLEMLRGDPLNLPTYINPSRKEIHLTHDDFVSVFKMDYFEFESLPKWRQTQLKKEHKLF